jgi:lysine-N-methylase
VRKTRLLRPEYSSRFSCIGSACEDNCCTYNWQIPVGLETVKKYHDMEPGSLKDLALASLRPLDDDPAQPGRMEIVMTPEGRCPLLTGQQLCRMHQEKGPDYLGATCLTYPRITNTVDNLEETSLSLSCPEAARLILLQAEPLAPPSGREYTVVWDDSDKNRGPLLAFFWQIRDLIVRLLGNRRYELWQRLFLVGVFCRRLDVVVREQPQRPFPVLLREFSAAIEGGLLRPAMERIPADPALQLDLLLRLIYLRERDAVLGTSFSEVLREFSAGIGLSTLSTPAQLVPAYSEAVHGALDPFLARHPQFLENLLINTVYSELLPFGPMLTNPSLPFEAEHSFTRLATQFAFIRGLLAGVAGHYGSHFGVEQAIRTVQATWRHFEHNKSYLECSLQLLAARGVDNTQGLTMLIRG